MSRDYLYDDLLKTARNIIAGRFDMDALDILRPLVAEVERLRVAAHEGPKPSELSDEIQQAVREYGYTRHDFTSGNIPADTRNEIERRADTLAARSVTASNHHNLFEGVKATQLNFIESVATLDRANYSNGDTAWETIMRIKAAARRLLGLPVGRDVSPRLLLEQIARLNTEEELENSGCDTITDDCVEALNRVIKDARDCLNDSGAAPGVERSGD